MTQVPASSTPPGTPRQAGTGNTGCVWIGLGLIVVSAIYFGNSKGPTTPSEQNALAAASINDAVASQTPSPIEPLDKSSVTRGFGHLRLALKAQGLSGAMIYSQNCYDALGRTFSWAKLDVCGGFDAIAVRALPEDDPGGVEKELAWFDAETAAGRYLSAAKAAGQAPEDADSRWSEVQTAAAKAASPKPKPAPKAAPDDEYYVDDKGNLSTAVPEDGE